MMESQDGFVEVNKTAFRKEMNEWGKEKGALIRLLQSAQSIFGYIPEETIYEISDFTGVPAADIYGVVTFYSQFRLTPMGKHVIRICEGTACHVNGAKGVLQALTDELGVDVDGTTEDGLFTLLSVACIGCCSLSPVIMIDNETFGSLTPEKTRSIIKEYRTSAH